MGSDTNRPSRSRRQRPNEQREPRVRFGGSGGAHTTPQLAEVDRAAQIMDFVIAAGDAILVSTTSDGGAVVVTVLAGDSREKAYASGQVELAGIFEQLEEGYTPK